MTDADRDLHISVPHVAPHDTPSPPPPHHTSFWIRELPFGIVLIFTIAGVAYTSISKRPIVTHWEILAPIIALVCVSAGWQEAGDKSGRLRLIVTQVLHWGAFLLVMNILLLSRVQRVFTAQTTALGIPAIAWIENSALLVVLIAAVIGVVAVLWWHLRQRFTPEG